MDNVITSNGLVDQDASAEHMGVEALVCPLVPGFTGSIIW